jgi:pilus assembly protein CpaE
MVIAYPHLLNDVNVAIVVCELTLASARDTIRILAWLKANASHCQTLVVANKVSTSALEISRKDFEGSIERKIDLMLPSDAKVTAQAAKLGKPVVEAARSSKLASGIASIAEQLKNAAPEPSQSDAKADAKAAKKASMLDGFKTLLVKKPKSPAA